MLSDMQKDVLVEIMNTNIGYAASLLSEMVSQKVILSVPGLDLKKGNELNLSEIGGHSTEFKKSVLSSIRFGKDFSGSAFLIFPAGKAKNLVLSCTDGMDCSDDCYTKLTSEDLDVIREISNIIFNAIIGEFGNLLDVKLIYTLPETELASVNKLGTVFLPEEIHFLAMYTSFMLSKSQVRGMIFIALSIQSEKMLIDKINEMLVDING